MPITAICTIIGAVSLSAFPLFSGFVTKTLILSALGKEGLVFAYFMLLFSSAGVLIYSGIRVPFFAFFANESKIKSKEAPIEYDNSHDFCFNSLYINWYFTILFL